MSVPAVPAAAAGHERAASGGGGGVGAAAGPSSRGLVGGALAWIGAPFGLGGGAAASHTAEATAPLPRVAPSSAPAKAHQFARAPNRTPGTVRQSGATLLTAQHSAAAAASSAHTQAAAAASSDSATASALSSRRNSTGNAEQQPSRTVSVRTESAPLSDGPAPDSLSVASPTATEAALTPHTQAAHSTDVFVTPVASAAAPSSESMPAPAAATVTLLGASKPDPPARVSSSRHRSTAARDALSSDSDLEGTHRPVSALDSLHAHPHALAAHFRRPLPPHRIQPSPPASPTPEEQATAAAASHPVAAAAASRPHSQSSADALEDEDGSQQRRLFKLVPAPVSPADSLPTGSPDTAAASMPAAQWVQSSTLAASQTAAPSQSGAATQLPPAADLSHSAPAATPPPSSAEPPARPPLHQSQSSQPQQLEMHQQLLQANANARAVTAAAEAPSAAASVPDPSLAMAHASSAPDLPALAALPNAAAAMPSMPSVPDLSSYSSAHFEEAQAAAEAAAAAAAASAAAEAAAASASPTQSTSILPGFFGFGSSSRANSGLAAASSASPNHVRSQSSSDNLAASGSGAAASSSAAAAAASAASVAAAPPRNIKLLNFQRVLSADVLDLGALKRLSWSGIPAPLRGQAWKLMLGYLPVHLSRRPTILAKRREEYASYLVDHYYGGMASEDYYAACAAAASLALGSPSASAAGQAPIPSPVSRSDSDHEILKQIQQDVPRTSPGLLWFKLPTVQAALERVLYIFAVRHPASGYVQGMNDLVTPFMTVFLMECYGLDIIGATTTAEAEALLASSPLASSSASAWLPVEADCYWCLSALLDCIQDHYTFAQPGIQKMIYRLQELVLRIDGNTTATVAASGGNTGGAGGGAASAAAPATGSAVSPVGLHAHLLSENVQFLHFAFRWMTCLLMRELRLPLILRLWDAYLSEDSIALGFREMHIYVCAALVIRFKDEIKAREFQQIIQFMQKLPTDNWTTMDVESLLAQAHLYRTWFHASPQHLA